MEKSRYVYWKDGKFWLGYLEEYPDYMTQGKTLKELQENLKDVDKDLPSGKIQRSKKKEEVNEMRREYDFSGGIRGKHFEAYRKGHTVRIDSA